MSWRCIRPVAGAGSAVDEHCVELARTDALHDIGEILANRSTRKQSPVHLELHLLRRGGPVTTHDLHADELQLVERRAVPEAHVALARASRAAAREREKT